jgi:hypothetical protein
MSSSNSIFSAPESLLLSTAIAGEAYLSASQSSDNTRKQIELAKIHLEQEKLYTPEERTMRFQTQQTAMQERSYHNKMDALKDNLIRWSQNRCSPITHHSVADEMEVRLMTSAHAVTSKHADSLKHVFDMQRSSCGTSNQYKFIYSWLNNALKDR